MLLHALGGTSSHWAGVAPELARHGPVHAVDLAGHGQTSAHIGASLDRNRELLAGLLADVGPAVLVGSSFGGGVAVLQAAADPRSVRGLVLSGSMLPLPAGESRLRRLVSRRLRQRGSDIVAAARALREGRLGPGRVTEYLLRGNAADPAGIDAGVVAEIVAASRGRLLTSVRTTIDAASSSMRLLTDGSRFADTVLGITAPALVIHGDQDRTVPVAHARAVAALQPSWGIEVLDGVGHLPHLERPRQWLSLVEAWLSASRRADR